MAGSGKFTRRTALFGAGLVAGGLATRALSPALPSLSGLQPTAPRPVPGRLNDASGLSETPVHRHITLSQDHGTALTDAIRAELREARAAGRCVNVGAARHSMGGQAIPRDGHALTFQTAGANAGIDLDTAARTMRVHAGARWRDVIAATDPLGLGPAVMQSNNDFGVGATFCVNAHGWPVRRGPMGSTVRDIELILPDGDLVTCSRETEAELFAMTMGGYGLTGIVTRLDVDLAPNQRLAPTFTQMPAEAFATAFTMAIADDAVTMAYGRLNVDRAAFMSQALLVTYRATDDQDDLPPATGSGAAARIASRIYRAQLGNERMKDVRWWFETDLAPRVAGGPATRNSLINEPVATLDDRDTARTDILHEYFVSPDRFGDFLTLCRAVIPGSYQEFLNVTLRFVDTDPDSWLAYAPVPRIAAVMSFSQEMTARAEADMARMTQAMIDGIVAIGGTYYLPYRLHARPDQFAQAYPRATAFAAAKRRLDPNLLLRNALWDTYLEAL